MKKLAITIVLFLALSATSWAQNDMKMSLDQAIQYSIENNMQVKISKNNINDADQQILERRAIGLPRLDADVSYNYFAIIPTTVLPPEFGLDPATGKPNPDFDRSVQFGVANNLTGGLNLSSLLFDGSYSVGLRAAKLFKEYVKEDLKAKQYDARQKAIIAYMPVVMINNGMNTLDKNIKNLEKLLVEVTAIQKAGFSEELDVDRLKLSLANLKTERNNLDRQKEMALNYLKFSINYPVEKELDVTDDLTTISAAVDATAIEGDLNYNARPEYAVINTGLKLSELNVKLYQAGYLPSLVGFANYQYSFLGQNLFGNDVVMAPTAIIGGKLSIPIFDGFEKKAKIQRARIQLINALDQKTLFEQGVNLEVINARKSYLSAQEKLVSQKENLKLAEKIYRTTQEKYKQGVGSSIEISQAEQELYSTQQNIDQALFDLIQAKLNLDKALGK